MKIRSLKSKVATNFTFFLCFSLFFPVFFPIQAKEVKIEWENQQQMSYGMDFERLWYWRLKKDEITKLAEYAVKDCKVSYVRVAIDGASEFEEGVFDWSVYKNQLECMNALKKANPDIKFFASPRPIHEAIKAKFGKDSEESKNAPFSCFPLWIGVFDDPYNPKRKFKEFHWEKAADYLVRQINYLREQGFDIAYLDIKNEGDRFYRPAELAKMIDRIRDTMGDKAPQIVGPSSNGTGGFIRWVKEAQSIERTDFFDFLSLHTNAGSSPKDLEEIHALAKTLNKPLWNTEMHDFKGPDELAVQNTKILFQVIRNGFGKINDWLSLGNPKKDYKMFRNIRGNLEVMRVYYIFKQLVNTSENGFYLKTNVPEGLAETAAFIQDNQLTIWLLNSSEVEIEDLKVSYEGRRATQREVARIWWDAENGREGSSDEMRLEEASSFTCNIKPNTLVCYRIPVRKP